MSKDNRVSSSTDSKEQSTVVHNGEESSGSLESFKPIIPDHELVACIGKGSYGRVWLGRNIMGEWRAIKFVHRTSFNDDRPFLREFEGIRRFEPISRSHPSQINILHIGRNEDSGFFYYVMELADPAVPSPIPAGPRNQLEAKPFTAPSETGTTTASPSPRIEIDPDTYQPRTLRKELHERTRLPVRECLKIAISLATALSHLHRHRLVHRDIKPANIIFVNGLPKLADIGLVAGLGESKTIVGTEGYMAPEGSGTTQADLYSLGKVIYEMVFGRKGQTFPELPPDWAGLEGKSERMELNEVVLRACESDPSARYASIRDLLHDLELIQSGRSIKRLRWLEQQQKLLKRVAIFGLLFATIASSGFWWQKRQTDIQLALTTQIKKTSARLERSLYTADMNLAFDALTENRTGRVASLINRHRPTSGVKDLRGWEWRYLWQQIQGDAVLNLDGHTNIVKQVEFLPNSNSILLAASALSLRKWDLKKRRAVQVLPTSFPIEDFALSHDGSTVAIATHHDTTLATVSTLESFDRFPIEADEIWKRGACVQFSKSDRFLYIGQKDGTIAIRSVTGKTFHSKIQAHESWLQALALSPNGRHLASGSRSADALKLWTISNETNLTFKAEIPTSETKIFDLEFTADNAQLIWCGSYTGKGEAIIGTSTLESPFDTTHIVSGHKRWVGDIELSPTNDRLFTSSADQTVRSLHLQDEDLKSIFHGHREEIWSLDISSDGSLLASGGRDGGLLIWDANQTSGSRNPITLTSQFKASGTSSDSRTFWTIHEGNRVKIWDSDNLQKISELRVDSQARSSVDINSKHRLFAISTFDNRHGEVEVWDLERQSKIQAFKGGRPFFSPDGRFLALASPELNIIDIIEVDGLKLLTRLEAPPPRENWPTGFSANGEILMANQNVYPNRGTIWNMETYEGTDFPFNHKTGLHSVRFSPKGLRAISISSLIMAWDFSTPPFEVSTEDVNLMGLFGASFSPDGERYALTTGSNSLWIYDGEQHQEIASIDGFGGLPSNVLFSPNGNNLIVMDSSQTVFVFQVPSFAEIREIEAARLEPH